MPQLNAATTKVYATFANVTCYDNAQWDASTQTLTRRPYDLQGRPVAPATRGLQILDGRKTIVK